MNENFRQGVAALKAGDRAAARRLLSASVRQSPEDAQAWLWLSGAVDRDEERLYCLRQVLQIDPGNQAAARGLAQMQERLAQAPRKQAAAAAQELAAPPPDTAHQAPVEEVPSQAAQQDLPAAEATAAPAPRTAPAQMVHRAANPNLRFIIQPGSDLASTTIFKTRPSLAQTLLSFWTMFFIVWIMNAVLQESTQLELSLSLLTCSTMGAVIAYLLVNLSLTRYELNTRQLFVNSFGKRITIPIRHILAVFPQQNWLQKGIKTADIIVEASVAGELQQVRLHNVSKFQDRIDQIHQLIREQE